MPASDEIFGKPSSVGAKTADSRPELVAENGDPHAVLYFAPAATALHITSWPGWSRALRTSRMHVSQVISRFRTTPWVFLILVFVLSLPAVTVRFYAADEIEYFAYLRSMWFDGDLSFDNEYRHFYYERGVAQGRRPRAGGSGHYGDRFRETFLEGRTATGLRINFAPVGTAILWAPFYLMTDAGVRIARSLGSDVAVDGYSWPYIAAVTFASALYGFLALLLSVSVARHIIESPAGQLDGRSAAATFAVWIGTPLLFYMYLAPGFSHAASAFAVAAFVALWVHVRRDWSWPGICALGAMAAIMGMVREQDLFIAIGPAIDYVSALVRAARSRDRPIGPMIARGAAGIGVAMICVLPQILTYVALYGRPAPSPTVEGKMTWTSPHAWQVLASPDNGLLFWTPLALAALAGLVWLAGRTWVGFLCLIMVMTQLYVSGSLDTWAGAGSFGQRRLVGLTIFFVIGLAALLTAVRHRWSRFAVNAFVMLAVWWNLGLTAQFGSGLMDRQHLDPARNAYDNFVTIPRRLPDLVYRFVLDRESFYQSRVSPAP